MLTNDLKTTLQSLTQSLKMREIWLRSLRYENKAIVRLLNLLFQPYVRDIQNLCQYKSVPFVIDIEILERTKDITKIPAKEWTTQKLTELVVHVTFLWLTENSDDYAKCLDMLKKISKPVLESVAKYRKDLNLPVTSDFIVCPPEINES